MRTLNETSQELASRAVSARALIEAALERISDPHGEGARAFLSISSESARAEADAIDEQRAQGASLPPFAGIPLAVKDLFDVKGEVTRAGSRVLADQPPATSDAPAIARVRAAGLVLIGRTNMTEFAYSGLGLNPHYGTPLNPYDRKTKRIPGGSTAGGAVAVADGMAIASVGTDTGGSCRIPAAFTGIVGFKPTASRIPCEGLIPLSPTLDSVGTLAPSVACCAALDGILSGAATRAIGETSLENVRLLSPSTLVLDGMDEQTAHTFERALTRLADAGARIVSQPLQALQRIPEVNAGGGFSAAEAYAWHRALLEQRASEYDPRVAARILKGRDITASDRDRLRSERSALMGAVTEATRHFDALVMPTTPIIAPPLQSLETDPEYFRLNALALRNPSLANFLDRCSISLPMQAPSEAPVGLMLIGHYGADARLFSVAHAIERALS